MSQIDLTRRNQLDAITSERWTASVWNTWTPQVRYARTASLESAHLAAAQSDGPVQSTTCDRYSAQLPLLRARLHPSGYRKSQSARRFRHVRRLRRLRNRGAGHVG